ncbi:MAG: biotin--[acetyl-CoA-carboxylase] ligase [Bacillota bacterium]|nr:biotin--[acetyl-CoA-carboxylase] ligase [Bacillota bacterium]
MRKGEGANKGGNLKEIVLHLLKQRIDQPVSGGELAAKLVVSRTAVWKAVNALRAEGYLITGTPRRGYQLSSHSDLILPGEIKAGLSTAVLGRRVEYRVKVTSTNTLARQLAEEGAEEGTVVLAEEQTAGRGRRGSTWFSPPRQGIWLSVLLRPQLSPLWAPYFTMAAALAALRAVQQAAGPEVPAGIKWPNDLLLRGRKVGGVLCEVAAEPDLLRYVVAGIGINVRQAEEDFPPALRAHSTSLFRETGRLCLRAPVIRQLLRELEDLYLRLKQGRQEEVRALYSSHCLTLGQEVEVRREGGAEPLSGRAEAIGSDGALLIRTAEGRSLPVYAGEVSLRRPGGGYA